MDGWMDGWIDRYIRRHHTYIYIYNTYMYSDKIEIDGWIAR